MTQTLPLTMILGATHTGKAIGYRVLNLDRTVYSAFATTGVGESATITGTYYVSGGIVAPLAGGHIVVGTVAEDLCEQTIESASANVTYLSGVALTSGAIPAAVAGATGGLAIVGSAMALADDAITAAKIAPDAIGSSELATSAVNEIVAAVLAGGTPSTYSYSNTVDNGSGTLLDGVLVELSTTIGMTNVIFSTHTNSSGAFTVYSDIAGTHYLRLQLRGYSFAIQTVTLA